MNRKFGIIALFSLFAAGVSAQESGVWTLKDCIDYALAHNIQLKKNEVAAQTAGIGVKQARAGLLPSLNASMSQGLTYRPFQETGGNIVNGGMASSSVDKAIQSGSYGVNASWTVWDGGRKRLNVKDAKLAQAMADLQTAVTANSIQEQITQLYVQILYMREAVNVNEKLLAQDSVVYARGEEMLRYGQISKVDLAQLAAQVSSGRYDVVNVKSQIEGYMTQLKQLLELGAEADICIAGLAVTDAMVLEDIPSKSEVYAAALDSRPEMQSSQMAIEQSRIATKIAKAAWHPSVSLTGGVGDSHLSGTRDNFFSQMKANFNASLGLSVSIPLYDNRQTKSAVEKAKVQEVASQLDLLDAQKTLYASVENYWLNATTSREKYIAAKANAESAELSYGLLQEQFRLGRKNIADLLSGRATLLAAKQTMLQDKYTTVLNRSLLEFYSGMAIEI